MTKAEEELQKHLNLEASDVTVLQELSALLAMDDAPFKIVSRHYADEFQRALNTPNARLSVARALNLENATYEQISENIKKLKEEVITKADFSEVKRAFLNELCDYVLNTVAESEGIAKRIITIPIEICNPNAKMPDYAHDDDSGMDVYAVEDYDIDPGETVIVDTGIKVAIPEGYELQVRPKSGLSCRSKLRIANTPGTIDAGFRDNIGIICENIDAPLKDLDYKIDEETGFIKELSWIYGSPIHISKGQKVAQLVLAVVPKCAWEEVDDVSTYGQNREGGFGSTGLFHKDDAAK